MTIKTAQPHGAAREILINRMLRELEERGEPLPESRPAEDQPER